MLQFFVVTGGHERIEIQVIVVEKAIFIEIPFSSLCFYEYRHRRQKWQFHYIIVGSHRI